MNLNYLRGRAEDWRGVSIKIIILDKGFFHKDGLCSKYVDKVLITL